MWGEESGKRWKEKYGQNILCRKYLKTKWIWLGKNIKAWPLSFK